MDSADVDEGGAEHGLGARVADVAAERERQAEAGGGAVDGCDHGLGQGAQPEHELGHVLLVVEAVAGQVAFVVGRRGAVAAQVDAGAEAAAGAGQDHRATGALQGDPAQLHVQRLAQLGGHRVELIGPVERELNDVRGGFLDEHQWGHGGESYAFAGVL